MGLIEDPTSSGEATTFGVKKNEVVGEVGGCGEEGLDIESMEGLSSTEVSLGNTRFQPTNDVLFQNREKAWVSSPLKKRKRN